MYVSCDITYFLNQQVFSVCWKATSGDVLSKWITFLHARKLGQSSAFHLAPLHCHPAPTGSPSHSSPTDLCGSHRTESNFSVASKRHFRVEKKLWLYVRFVSTQPLSTTKRILTQGLCKRVKNPNMMRKTKQGKCGLSGPSTCGRRGLYSLWMSRSSCSQWSFFGSGQKIQVSDSYGLFNFLCNSRDSKHLDYYGCNRLVPGDTLMSEHC